MAVDYTAPSFSGGSPTGLALTTAFADIETALKRAVSIDGDLPNAMEADLDLNGHDLLNVGEAGATIATTAITDELTEKVDENTRLREALAATVQSLSSSHAQTANSLNTYKFAQDFNTTRITTLENEMDALENTVGSLSVGGGTGDVTTEQFNQEVQLLQTADTFLANRVSDLEGGLTKGAALQAANFARPEDPKDSEALAAIKLIPGSAPGHFFTYSTPRTLAGTANHVVGWVLLINDEVHKLCNTIRPEYWGNEQSDNLTSNEVYPGFTWRFNTVTGKAYVGYRAIEDGSIIVDDDPVTLESDNVAIPNYSKLETTAISALVAGDSVKAADRTIYRINQSAIGVDHGEVAALTEVTDPEHGDVVKVGSDTYYWSDLTDAWVLWDKVSFIPPDARITPVEGVSSWGSTDADVKYVPSLYSSAVTLGVVNKVVNAKMGTLIQTGGKFPAQDYWEGVARGSGVYLKQPAGTDTADGGSVIDYGGFQLKFIHNQYMNPWHFSALGGDHGTGNNDAPAINAWNTWFQNSDEYVAEFNGHFRIDETIWIGGDQTLGVRYNGKTIIGSPEIDAKNYVAFDSMVRIEANNRLTWVGIPECYGGQIDPLLNKALHHAGRNVTDIYYFGLNTQCTFTGFFARYALHWGLSLINKASAGDPDYTFNSTHNMGNVRCFQCGSGTAQQSPGAVAASKAHYSDYVVDAANSNTAYSVAQRTRLDLTNMIPEGTGTGDNASFVAFHVDGDVYQVMDRDYVNNWIEIYPRLSDTTATSGSGYFQFGGAVGIAGPDTNLLTFEMVATQECATAFYAGSLYGPKSATIVSQFDNTALEIGQQRGAAMRGGEFNIYVEGELRAIHRRSIEGDHCRINCMAFAHPERMIETFSPRATNNGFDPAVSFFEGWTFNYYGAGIPSHHKLPSRQEVSQFYEMNLLNAGSQGVFRMNGATDIRLKSAFTGSDMKTGLHFFYLFATGRTSVNQAPTGSFTFKVDPDGIAAGETIQGGNASEELTLQGFGGTGPVMFLGQFNESTKVWYIRAMNYHFTYSGGGVGTATSIATGTTAQRPTTPTKGDRYFDDTLGHSIEWNGSVWTNGTNSVSV